MCQPNFVVVHAVQLFDFSVREDGFHALRFAPIVEVRLNEVMRVFCASRV